MHGYNFCHIPNEAHCDNQGFMFMFNFVFTKKYNKLLNNCLKFKNYK